MTLQEPYVAPDGDDAVGRTVAGIGRRIRATRESAGLPLREVAKATGLSTSMLSLVERGQTTPSIGTLMSICDALSMTMASLFAGSGGDPAVVIRADDTISYSADGATRRIIISDRQHRLELSEHFYEPGSASAGVPTHHTGDEIGIILSGELSVELNDATHRLKAGDAVHFPSTIPHRFTNRDSQPVHAIWLNIHSA